jgi:hypothetical protein
MLQDDIRRRAGEEERLLRVNSQLKVRVEEAMETNNLNVETAESELQVRVRLYVVGRLTGWEAGSNARCRHSRACLGAARFSGVRSDVCLPSSGCQRRSKTRMQPCVKKKRRRLQW